MRDFLAIEIELIDFEDTLSMITSQMRVGFTCKVWDDEQKNGITFKLAVSPIHIKL